MQDETPKKVKPDGKIEDSVSFNYELRDNDKVCIVEQTLDIDVPLGKMEEILSITQDIKEQIESPKLDSSQTRLQKNDTVSFLSF